MPIIPPRNDDEELVATSIRIKKKLMRKLDEIVEREKANRYSRNDIMEFILEWGAEQYEKEKKLKKG